LIDRYRLKTVIIINIKKLYESTIKNGFLISRVMEIFRRLIFA